MTHQDMIDVLAFKDHCAQVLRRRLVAYATELCEGLGVEPYSIYSPLHTGSLKEVFVSDTVSVTIRADVYYYTKFVVAHWVAPAADLSQLFEQVMDHCRLNREDIGHVRLCAALIAGMK